MYSTQRLVALSAVAVLAAGVLVACDTSADCDAAGVAGTVLAAPARPGGGTGGRSSVRVGGSKSRPHTSGGVHGVHIHDDDCD